VVVLYLTACSAAQPTSTPVPPATAPPTAIPPSPVPPTPLPPTPAPTAVAGLTPTPQIELSKLGYHAAAYDIESDRVIVFGGTTDPQHGLSDTWTYNVAANTWARMSPSQSPGIVEGPMAYDSVSDRTILFAGNLADANFTSSPGKPYGIDKASQTWAYDCNTDSWTDLHAMGTPSGLLGAGMAYDTQSDRMILFGGLEIPLPANSRPFVFHNETWAYAFKTNTWTNMNPKISPPGRNFFQMVYDAVSDRVLVWGSMMPSDGNDLWAYDLETNTWTAQPVKQPLNRDYGAMTYVSTLRRVLLFGGVTLLNETPFDDMWSYDAAAQAWDQVRVSSGPSARGWHTLTYSTKSDRVVLIGGGKDRAHYTNEVWIFDPQAKTWTQVGPR
jgi:hypothetical protein